MWEGSGAVASFFCEQEAEDLVALKKWTPKQNTTSRIKGKFLRYESEYREDICRFEMDSVLSSFKSFHGKNDFAERSKILALVYRSEK